MNLVNIFIKQIEKISIIIPFYNEEQNIEKILEELLNFVIRKRLRI